MRMYKDWAPSGFDAKGLALDEDRQWWYVVPVILTRDGDCMERSNFYSAEKLMAKADASDYERHSFGHWACGWFDILIVKPNTRAAEIAEDIERRLDNYPILDESDCSEREHEEAAEVWRGCYSESERIEYIRRRRHDFEFRSFADMLRCVRGKYFAGATSDFIYG